MNFGKPGFLEELADGELLDSGKNRALGAKRCLSELFLIHFGARKADWY